MASLTHQWLLLSFATEVVKILYHCCSIYFPNLHFHFTSALLPPPPLTTFCSLLSQDVKSVPFSFWFMTPVMLVCMCSVSIYPAVHVHLTSETDWYLKKGKCELYSSPFPCLSFAGFLPFLFTFYVVLSLLGCSSRRLRCKFTLTHTFIYFLFFPIH